MKITYTDRSIGPAHDQYSAMEVSITVDNRSATYYSDGLGRNWYRLCEDGIEVRIEKWFDGTDDATRKRAVAAKAKGNIFARRLVGMTFDEAIDEAFEQEGKRMRADPFGGRDPYFGHA